MIVIHQRADEASRSPDRPCYYDAEANVLGGSSASSPDAERQRLGQSYTVRGRYGACHDIARQLVAAGIPDQPVTTIQEPQGWRIGYPSLHPMALRTIVEGVTTTIREAVWKDPAERFATLAGAAEHLPQNRGEAADHGSLAPPAETPSFEAAV